MDLAIFKNLSGRVFICHPWINPPPGPRMLARHHQDFDIFSRRFQQKNLHFLPLLVFGSNLKCVSSKTPSIIKAEVNQPPQPNLSHQTQPQEPPTTIPFSMTPVPLELLIAVSARYAKLAKSVLLEHLPLKGRMEGWDFVKMDYTPQKLTARP